MAGLFYYSFYQRSYTSSSYIKLNEIYIDRRGIICFNINNNKRYKNERRDKMEGVGRTKKKL